MERNVRLKWVTLLVGVGILLGTVHCDAINPKKDDDNGLLLGLLLLNQRQPEFAVSMVGEIRIPGPNNGLVWDQSAFPGANTNQKRYASARRMVLENQEGSDSLLDKDISQITSGADAKGKFSFAFRLRRANSALRIRGLGLSPDQLANLNLDQAGNSAVGDNPANYQTPKGTITFNLVVDNANPTALEQIQGLQVDSQDFTFSVLQIRTFRVGTYDLPNPTIGEQVCDGKRLRGAPQIKSGEISQSETWEGGILLQGTVQVAAGVTITVKPGTVIFGQRGSSIFFLQSGNSVAKLNAVGTAQDPICWTSSSRPGSRFPGDWGGIVTIGNAGATRTALTEGTTPKVYGGAAGSPIVENVVMKYNIVEFGGNEVAPGDELNNLSMYASSSKLEYVQAHRGLDDQFEAWGGVADWNKLLATGGLDDDYDLDEGITGTIKNIIGHKYPVACGGSPSGDPHGFEMDGTHSGSANQGSNCGSGGAPPANPLNRCTDVTVENITLIGANISSGDAMRLRDGFAGTVKKAVVWNFQGNGSQIIRADIAGGFPANKTTLQDIALPSSPPNGIGSTVTGEGPSPSNVATILTALPIRSLGATEGGGCGFGPEKPDYRLTDSVPNIYAGGAAEGEWYKDWTVYRAR